MKKFELSVIKKTESLKQNNIELLEKMIYDKDQKIQEGLEKETAGTGTPIKKLKGSPKDLARLSNIGGGSKANGGGGYIEGIKILIEREKLKLLEKIFKSL